LLQKPFNKQLKIYRVNQVKKDLFFDVVGICFPAPPHPQALSTDVDDTEIRKTKREDGELAIAAVLAQVAMGDVIPIYYI
jgi:hypothetical protein